MKAPIHGIPQIILAGAVLLLAACGSDPAPAPAAPPPAPVVVVETPRQETVTRFLDLTGRTEALKTVEIRAQSAGYIQEIHFQDGAGVNKGDLLFTIDPRSYAATLKEAEAALASRVAEKNLAEKTHARRRSALADNAVSELSVEEAEAQLSLAVARVEAAEAQVDRARLDLSYTRVTAPVTGRISRRLTHVGNLIQPGDSPVLATLIVEDPIYVYFTLSEGELLKFNGMLKGQQLAESKPKVMLGLSNSQDHPFLGFIDYLDTAVDPGTGTLQARAVFPNEERLLVPGLYARIRAPLEELEGAILAPESALGVNQSGRFLIVVDNEEKAAFRTVEIGPQVGDRRVITSGLSTTDRVVIKGGQMLQPGTPVTVQWETEVAPGVPGGPQ